LVYIVLDLRSHHHHHSHDINPDVIDPGQNKSRWITILTTLSIAMFLTPCIEIEAYYFQAGTIGWTGIIIVSAVYLLTTVLVMLFLVYWGIKGARSFKSHFLEHHEKRISGLVLISLGILALLVKF